MNNKTKLIKFLGKKCKCGGLFVVINKDENGINCNNCNKIIYLNK